MLTEFFPLPLKTCRSSQFCSSRVWGTEKTGGVLWAQPFNGEGTSYWRTFTSLLSNQLGLLSELEERFRNRATKASWSLAWKPQRLTVKQLSWAWTCLLLRHWLRPEGVLGQILLFQRPSPPHSLQGKQTLKKSAFQSYCVTLQSQSLVSLQSCFRIGCWELLCYLSHGGSQRIKGHPHRSSAHTLPCTSQTLLFQVILEGRR